MDSNTRTILLSLIAVLTLPVLCLILAVLIPFNVTQPADISAMSGEVELDRVGKRAATLMPSELEESQSLDVGESVRVAPGGSVTVTFFNGGRAILTGPAALRLVESNRRATALGHASSKFDRDYKLVIEQSKGSVFYRFDGADPGVTITIRLPDRTYKPTSPCWTINIGLESTTAESAPCPQ